MFASTKQLLGLVILIAAMWSGGFFVGRGSAKPQEVLVRVVYVTNSVAVSQPIPAPLPMPGYSIVPTFPGGTTIYGTIPL